MDSQALPPSYVISEMEVSLLVRARGPLCRDTLVVGWPGEGGEAVPAVVGAGALNKTNNGHQLITSPKVTPDAVLPSVQPPS
jgi:hypothetical protein